RRRGVPPDLGIPPGARRLAHGLAGGTSRRRQHFPPGEPEPVRRARVGLHPMGVTGHVVFSHGLDGSPFGTKIRALYEIAEAEGYEVAAVDYRGVDDPEERVPMLPAICRGFSRHLPLVGASLGGNGAAPASPPRPAGGW